MRRRRVKLAIGGAVAAVLIGALAVGLTRSGEGNSPKLVSGGPSLTGTTPAPEVKGPDLLTGRTIDLTSFRGKPVIVNVWASWCEPCRKEAPEILRFTKERPDIAFLGVDVNDTRRNGRGFNTQAGWTHPSIFDPGGLVGVDKLKVASLPATIYIDAKGVIRGRTQGPVTFGDLVSAADRL